jgi:hypothetical protein
VPLNGMEALSIRMSLIRDSLFQEAIEKAQQLGLSGVIHAVPGEVPAPTLQQRKVVESWAKDIYEKHGKRIDDVMRYFAYINFSLQLERFDE